jgi:hypothetical protein
MGDKRGKKARNLLENKRKQKGRETVRERGSG